MKPFARTIDIALQALLGLLLSAIVADVAASPAKNRSATDHGYAQRPEVRAFVDEMAAEHGFERRSLMRLFAQTRYQPKVIDLMSRPVIAPPKWHEYAPQFLTLGRIDAGVAFWQTHAAVLDRARQEFGVPPAVIVAILGVETYYGRHTGTYRVLDALTTLAFDYPRRAEFFRGELKQFLLLAREQHISPLAAKGSYAGALGLPQFMPGSVRAYAVDYDADGNIDLWEDPADAIGSVAHYLARHDWQSGQPVWTAALVDPAAREIIERKLDGGITERRSLEAWARDGVRAAAALPDKLAADPVGLLMLEEVDGPTYWLVFNNWYVLTRYNKSRLYASAVWELAQAIQTAFDRAREAGDTR